MFLLFVAIGLLGPQPEPKIGNSNKDMKHIGFFVAHRRKLEIEVGILG
jgi:hypothetical protein